MKCQNLFSGINKKKVGNMSSAGLVGDWLKLMPSYEFAVNSSIIEGQKGLLSIPRVLYRNCFKWLCYC